jgi:hypothetical protein
MFIHFSEWSSIPKPTVQKIADAYPQPHEFTVRLQKRSENGKYNGPTYCTLLCYIDTRTKPVDKDAEISSLKAQVELLQDEVKKMNIEVLHRDELIDELLKDNSKYERELHELKDKYKPDESLLSRQPSYIHYPSSDEEILVDSSKEEPCGFAPCNTLDLSTMEFNEENQESSAEVDRGNTQVLHRGLADRHLKSADWYRISKPKQEPINSGWSRERFVELSENYAKACQDDDDYDEDRGGEWMAY